MQRKPFCRALYFWTSLAFVLAITLPVSVALANRGDCGQPVSNGHKPAAGDALVVLKVSVGAGLCGDSDDDCECDVDDSGRVTPSDALIVLRSSVGFPSQMNCGHECVPTTTLPGQTTTTEPGNETTTTEVAGETTTTISSPGTTMVCCKPESDDDDENVSATAECEEDIDQCTAQGGVLVAVQLTGSEDDDDACDVTPNPCLSVTLPPPTPCCVSGDDEGDDNQGDDNGDEGGDLSVTISTETEAPECKALPSSICALVGTPPVNGSCAFTNESGQPDSVPCP